MTLSPQVDWKKRAREQAVEVAEEEDAYLRGVADALEEAARVADKQRHGVYRSMEYTAKKIAAAIRALKPME